MSKPKIEWLDAPEEHDYPAAADYLSLVMGTRWAVRVVKDLRAAPPSKYKAKDICRASELPLLDEDNPHVAKDLAKVADGTPLSPVLLVRGDMLFSRRALVIADGYHRICAAHILDENAEIPCRIVTP